MSAWLCSNRHFQFVAKAAEVHRLIPVGTADTFARQLKLENLRSLHARYGDPIPEDLEDEHTWDISDIASYIESPGFIKHEVTCLDYQSCEHGGWRDPNNKVAQVVNQLWELVKDADEDPKAPWGIGWEVGKLSTWDHENEGVG